MSPSPTRKSNKDKSPPCISHSLVTICAIPIYRLDEILSLLEMYVCPRQVFTFVHSITVITKEGRNLSERKKAIAS
jgi:hypothetical protein